MGICEKITWHDEQLVLPVSLVKRYRLSYTAKIACVGGLDDAVQGQSRSPILVPIESPYATSC